MKAHRNPDFRVSPVFPYGFRSSDKLCSFACSSRSYTRDISTCLAGLILRNAIKSRSFADAWLQSDIVGIFRDDFFILSTGSKLSSTRRAKFTCVFSFHANLLTIHLKIYWNILQLSARCNISINRERVCHWYIFISLNVSTFYMMEHKTTRGTNRHNCLLIIQLHKWDWRKCLPMHINV